MPTDDGITAELAKVGLEDLAEPVTEHIASLGMFAGLSRMLDEYAALMDAEWRWSLVRWHLFETGRMPAEPWGYRWYTDLPPWSRLRPLSLRWRAWRREVRERLAGALDVLRTGVQDPW